MVGPVDHPTNRSPRESPAPRGRRTAGAVRDDPPWLQRLWSRQRVPLNREKLHWWSVHVLRFLEFIRTHQVEGPVDVLASQFLADLAVHQPPPSERGQGTGPGWPRFRASFSGGGNAFGAASTVGAEDRFGENS